LHQPRAIRHDAAKSALIDEHVANWISPNDPGLALAVVTSGTVVHAAGYGLANIRRHDAATQRTIFHLASCGKQFTALGILMLADEGKLALDDPLAKHLPSLACFGPEVTLRRLLHHTAGVCHDDDEDWDATASGDRLDDDDVLDAYFRLVGPVLAGDERPGSAFNYSNSGYDLLGFTIERVSGQSYQDFFKRRVFEPLGMSDTFSIPNSRTRGRRCAAGYVYDRDGEIAELPDDGDDAIEVPGWFYTTVTDLCLYDRALATNALVSERCMREALTSGCINDGSPVGYGFGWFLGTHQEMRFAEHSGEGIGFYTHMRRYLEQPLSIFVLSNNPEVDLEDITTTATIIFL
jgi:CubicO group peptidase (beta-lactamase class C family)